jgi:hypothetical protein
MARSLFRQLEQIRNSGAYDDAVSSANLPAIAEPSVSGTLEADMNVLRTLFKQVKGNTNWYDDPGTYFDPTNTDGGNTTTKQMSLANIKGNTLDSKTVIIAVSDDNSGSGYTVSGTSTGVLISPTTATYAIPTDRRGLPIFNSVTNSGTYYDEGGADNVCRVDIINTDTDGEIQDSSGYTIYGKLHDGADFSGSGAGSDVYVRFYANGSPCDLSAAVGSPTNITFVYPYRRRMSDVAEYEWLRTDFVSSWEGDVVLIEDISNLWSYTGASDGDDNPQPWDNTTASYILQTNPSDLTSAINDLNDGIGDRLYSEENYITDGWTITAALEALDTNLKDVADSVTASSGDKYVESAASLISKNVEHPLPYSITYTPSSTAGREGMNMDVYVDGQLLAADTGVNGANADRDYAETTASGITFRFNIQAGRNITYVVRQ